MIQEIITYIIIGAAVIYTLYSFFVITVPSKKKHRHSCCGGCSGCALSKKSGSTKFDIKKIN